jgi:hypothetical protein
MGEALQTIVDNAIKMAIHAKQQIKTEEGSLNSLTPTFVGDLILILCSERPVTTTLEVGNSK